MYNYIPEVPLKISLVVDHEHLVLPLIFCPDQIHIDYLGVDTHCIPQIILACYYRSARTETIKKFFYNLY
jgi:hypothetical protein